MPRRRNFHAKQQRESDKILAKYIKGGILLVLATLVVVGTLLFFAFQTLKDQQQVKLEAYCTALYEPESPEWEGCVRFPSNEVLDKLEGLG